MAEAIIAQVVQNALSKETTLIEKTPHLVQSPALDTISPVDLKSQADLFRELVDAYPNGGLAEGIHASNAAHKKRKKSSGFFEEVFDSIESVTDQWRNTLHSLTASNVPKTYSYQDVLRTQMVMAQASMTFSCVSNAVGKSIQNLETLLRMQ